MSAPVAADADLPPALVAAAIEVVVARALAEDLGGGVDVTTVATVPVHRRGAADVVARADGVVAGLAAAAAVVAAVDPGVVVTERVRDGDRVERGDVLARWDGALRSILVAERTALNLLGHLGGVATLTRAFVDAVAGTGATIRDTRKTTPGLRVLEKAAVRSGGGSNHRIGLHDALLVKDNHIEAAGSVTAAVTAALAGAGGRPVQVEVTSLDELDDALAAGATDLLLDNMTPDEVRVAVERTAGRAVLEASGTVRLGTCRAYAETGVDRLAVGALTHSAPWLDVALEVRTVAGGDAGERLSAPAGQGG